MYTKLTKNGKWHNVELVLAVFEGQNKILIMYNISCLMNLA